MRNIFSRLATDAVNQPSRKDSHAINHVETSKQTDRQTDRQTRRTALTTHVASLWTDEESHVTGADRQTNR